MRPFKMVLAAVLLAPAVVIGGMQPARAESDPAIRDCVLEVRADAPMEFAAGNDRDFDDHVRENEIEVFNLEAGESPLPFPVGNRHFVFVGRLPEGSAAGDFKVTVVCEGWTVIGQYDCSMRPARNRIDKRVRDGIFGSFSGSACAVTGVF